MILRILDKRILACDPDAAWRAVQSPTVFSELYGPLLTVARADGDDLPVMWAEGERVRIRMRVGPIAVGEQVIHPLHRALQDTSGSVRILRDAGTPVRGPLAMIRGWDHQMAVSHAPGDPTKTLWRERLVLRGWAAPVFWPVLWMMWQLRGVRLARLAPTWAADAFPATRAPA